MGANATETTGEALLPALVLVAMLCFGLGVVVGLLLPHIF